MDAIRELLHLGGYGFYVWPAYGTAIVILGWMAVSTLRRLRNAERTLKNHQNMRAEATAPGAGEGNMKSGDAGS